MTHDINDPSEDDIDDLPASFLNPTGVLSTAPDQQDQDDDDAYETQSLVQDMAREFTQELPLILDASDTDMRLIEAILFASATPMSVAEIQKKLPHLDPSVFRRQLERLRQEYDGRGVVLEEADGRWAFRTAADLSEALHGLRTEERNLSRAAQETLSVIAYHQPITRPEIEAVRGVATSKGTVDLLLETGWIKPGRRRETPGRPLTWVTTHAFLDHFGLETIMDLPGIDDLKAAGLLDRRPAASITADLFDNEDGDGDDVAASLEDDVLEQQG